MNEFGSIKWSHMIEKCSKLLRIQLILAFLIVAAAGAHADGKWRLEPIDPSAFPPEIVIEDRQPVQSGLPDGLITTNATGDISSAWYTQPTTRYGHGILGDAIEAGGLQVVTRAGKTHSLQLPETEVFEDRYPRLADLDGDGDIEVITIRSSVSEGGSVTVYGLKDAALVELSTTGFIGRPNRWLNIAGIASFTDGKAQQIAFVSTPHIGGTLHVYEFDGEKLTRIASKYGFSNHVIGSREMRLSALADIDGNGNTDLVLPSADRNTVRMMALKSGKLTELAAVPLQSSVDKAIKVERQVTGLSFIVGVSNGQVFSISR